MKDEGKIHPGAVIFDMDGLMLDTERPMVTFWCEAGEKYGWDIKPELVIKTLGIDKEGSIQIFINELGPDFPYEAIHDEFAMMVRERFADGIAHKPGLLSLLDHLAALGIPIGVATSTKRETALWKLGIAGVLDRFAAVTCGDEVSRSKPAPDIFLLAAKRLGKEPSECVGFEDSPAGLKGLHSAGIRSVFIKDLADPPADVLSAVWRRCGDLAEAVQFFG